MFWEALGGILGRIVGAGEVGGALMLAAMVVAGAAAPSWLWVMAAAGAWSVLARLLLYQGADVPQWAWFWPDFLAAALVGLAAHGVARLVRRRTDVRSRAS